MKNENIAQYKNIKSLVSLMNDMGYEDIRLVDLKGNLEFVAKEKRNSLSWSLAELEGDEFRNLFQGTIKKVLRNELQIY